MVQGLRVDIYIYGYIVKHVLPTGVEDETNNMPSHIYIIYDDLIMQRVRGTVYKSVCKQAVH